MNVGFPIGFQKLPLRLFVRAWGNFQSKLSILGNIFHKASHSNF